MGSMYLAECRCGYTHEIHVGKGAMADSPDLFPFFCDQDGLILVNVEATRLRCPRSHCRTSRIRSYGRPPISPMFGKREQHGDRALTLSDNLCPACQQMNLNFSLIGNFD